jgi:hypothetical protein
VDFSNPEDDSEQEKNPIFKPYVGDCLMKLKTGPPENPVYLWRVILTDRNVKKVWPEDNHDYDNNCEHKDLYWAIDFNKKLITLCNECDKFAYGHKVAKND